MTDGPNHVEVAVCTHADVAVVTSKQVARDDDGVAVEVAGDALALDRENRVEPGREPPRDRLLPHPPLRPRAAYAQAKVPERRAKQQRGEITDRSTKTAWLCVCVCVCLCVFVCGCG